MSSSSLVDTGEGVLLGIPHHWGRTAAVVYTSEEDGEGVSLVVRRTSIDPRTSLPSYADFVLVELAKTLPNFSLEERKSRSVGGREGSELAYTLSARGSEYYQRQCIALDTPGSALTITATCKNAERNQHNSLFEEIFATVTFSHRGLSR